MRTALPALVTTFVLGVALDARVDPVFLRQWNDAQKQRPSTVTSSSRIAPASEPGTPFIIHGQVIDVEGSPPPRSRSSPITPTAPACTRKPARRIHGD